MKKIILTLAVVFAAAQLTFAQTDTTHRHHPTPQQRTEQKIKAMDEKMSLTDEQKSQIRALYSAFYDKKLQGDERKEAMRQVNDDIVKLLTDEQKPKFRQLMKENRENKKKDK